MRFVMVLNDGETFTSLEGCKILALDDDLLDEDEEFAIKDGPERSEFVHELATWPVGFDGNFLPTITAKGVGIILDPQPKGIYPCTWGLS